MRKARGSRPLRAEATVAARPGWRLDGPIANRSAGWQPAPHFDGSERGYALLTVFLMAALVALFLYAQLPRVAFESERDKEQSLIDRGEQYKRAIQLYVLAVKKYPQKIEDLENTNNKRYLRQRYIDPYTGKDEWRLIHVNAAGVLTDSLVQKPPTPDGKPATDSPLSASSSTGTTGATGSTGDTNDVNAAVRRRPSDLVGNAYTQPVDADPSNPASWAPITIASPTGTANGQPVVPSGAVGFNAGGVPGAQGQNGMPGAAGAPGTFPLPGQPGFNPTQNQFKIDVNGQLVPVTPTQTAQNGQQPTQVPGQMNGMQPQSGVFAPGINPAGNSQAAQNVATQAINQMLTNPNAQAGMANGLGTSAGMMGGIAGVASNYKGPSIKIYATRQKYQEWEFIFSMNNQQGAPRQGNPLQPGQNGLNPQQGSQGSGTAPAAGSTLGGTGTTGNP